MPLPLGIAPLAALAVAAVLMPLTMWVARRSTAVDAPSARRVHKLPTPRLGGVAIFAATAATAGGGAGGDVAGGRDRPARAGGAAGHDDGGGVVRVRGGAAGRPAAGAEQVQGAGALGRGGGGVRGRGGVAVADVRGDRVAAAGAAGVAGDDALDRGRHRRVQLHRRARRAGGGDRDAHRRHDRGGVPARRLLPRGGHPALPAGGDGGVPLLQRPPRPELHGRRRQHVPGVHARVGVGARGGRGRGDPRAVHPRLRDERAAGRRGADLLPPAVRAATQHVLRRAGAPPPPAARRRAEPPQERAPDLGGVAGGGGDRVGRVLQRGVGDVRVGRRCWCRCCSGCSAWRGRSRPGR